MTKPVAGSVRDHKSWRGVGACLLAALCLQVVPCRAGQPANPGGRFAGKKVLYIDSYHPEYIGGIVQEHAVREVLEPEGIAVRDVYLDEKRHGDEPHLRQAAREVMEVVRDWRPDLIIAADDASNKYVIVPYLKDASIPVVFIGVNWTADQYGYPLKNVTGQIEVELIQDLIDQLRHFARGQRIAILTADTLTDRKTLDYYRSVMKIRFSEERLVGSFAQWKKAYTELQGRCDGLVFRNNTGISGWSDQEAKEFIQATTRVPTGTVSSHMTGLVLISLAKDNGEFGEWAGQTALEIFAGKPPSSIPITTNKRGKLVLNMSLAKRLGITFPMDLIERATFTEEVR